MARKRALKEAARDPLAKKETAPAAPDPKDFRLVKFAITVAVAVIVGFVGGVAASRFVRLI